MGPAPKQSRIYALWIATGGGLPLAASCTSGGLLERDEHQWDAAAVGTSAAAAAASAAIAPAVAAAAAAEEEATASMVAGAAVGAAVVDADAASAADAPEADVAAHVATREATAGAVQATVVAAEVMGVAREAIAASQVAAWQTKESCAKLGAPKHGVLVGQLACPHDHPLNHGPVDRQIRLRYECCAKPQRRNRKRKRAAEQNGGFQAPDDCCALGIPCANLCEAPDVDLRAALGAMLAASCPQAHPRVRSVDLSATGPCL